MPENTTKRQTANLSEIAEAAGVSKMTVSRVLRDKDGFSEATRQKVMLEVERLGYLPNRIAAAFGQTQASTLIGVCVPRLSNHFFGLALESIDRTIQSLGFLPVIGSHNQVLQDEEAWLKSILSWRPAGVMLSTKHHSNTTLQLLRDAGIPIVEFWELSTSPLDMSVGFNQFDSGFQMGRHASIKGYSRAGILGASHVVEARRPEHIEGFIKGFTDGGGTIVHHDVLNDAESFYAGFYGTETMLNRSESIDMIYYQDDTMALGGLSWCQGKSIRIPDDVGLAGWGGHEATSILRMELTTTSIPTHLIGKLSAEALVRKLRSERTEDVTAVPTRLIDGDTL